MNNSAANTTSTIRFHSAYNPLKEAERFVANSLKDKKPGIIVVLGPGENYIKQILDTNFSYAKKYYIQPCTIFDTNETEDPYYWSPSNTMPLKDFLHKILYDEYSGAGIAVLEWEPVTRTFEKDSAYIRNELAKILAATASEKATIAYWSRRWITNSIKFSKSVKTILTIDTISKPIAIIASGPGLQEHLEFLKKNKISFFIICIASALPALVEHNCIPDAVFLSDPGYWNTFHTRILKNHSIPIIMPPSARLPSELFDREFIVINTHLIFETLAIQALQCPCYTAKAFGTSVGTALDFALSITNKEVFIFGFDLSAYDITSHCMPYAFLNLSLQNDSRLMPFHAKQYSEVLEQFPETCGRWRFSRSFNTYAQELPISAGNKNRIIRFSESPIGSLNESIALITKNFFTYNFSLLNRKITPHIFSKKLCSEQIPITKLLSNYFTDIIKKLQIIPNATLSYDEIIFLKAISIKKFNEFFALAIRKELTPEHIDSFITICSDEFSALLQRYDIT